MQMFVKNPNFGETCKFLSKIEPLVKNLNLGKKIQLKITLLKNRNFGQKIKILDKNHNFCPKILVFDKNPNFGQKS